MLKTKNLLVIICAIAIAGCATRQSILTTDSLPVQSFTININTDTILQTAQGCKISIAAGSIKTNGSSARLTIKEAITPEQILLSGLTTTSNGKPLSSSGMIYINADDATLIKPITVTIPAPFIQNGMEVFKGVEENGEINWVDPKPINATPANDSLLKGEKLFNQHCTSCHNNTLINDATGPMLWNVQQRHTIQWLKDFTLNSSKLLASRDVDALRIYRRFNKQVMTKFEGTLSNTDLNNIYAYIKNKSAKSPWVKQFQPDLLCEDSCNRYKAFLEMRDTSITVIDSLINAEFKNIQMKDSINLILNKYEFAIEDFGWNNVDILTSDLPGSKQCTLQVTINNNNNKDFNVHFFVPSFSINTNSTNNTDGVYSFTYNPFNMPLNTPAYILAYKKEGEKILMGITAFPVQQKNLISVSLSLVSTAVFEQQLKDIAAKGAKEAIAAPQQIIITDTLSNEPFGTDNLDTTYAVVDSLYEIRRLKAEQLRPKNCDCGFLDEWPEKAPKPANTSIKP